MARKRRQRRGGGGNGFTRAQLKQMGVDLAEFEREQPEAQLPSRELCAEAKATRLTLEAGPPMNKLEARYERQLDMLKHVGVIADYRFECIKLRLGPNWLTGYTPDFLVILPDGLIEVHEVKGFWEDDARVKIKTAAGLFPFRFIAVTEKKGGGWAREVFYPEV